MSSHSSDFSPRASSSCPLMELVESGELKVGSRLDEFRIFFDLKKDSWEKMRALLAAHVAEVSTWATLFADEAERRKGAEGFLQHHGDEFWGSQRQRRKYLMEASLARSDVCRYPEKIEPMTLALMMLLLKTARTHRRDSGSTVKFPNLKTPPSTKVSAGTDESGGDISLSPGPQESSSKDQPAPAAGPVGFADTQASSETQKVDFQMCSRGLGSDASATSAPFCGPEIPFDRYAWGTSFLVRDENRLGTVCVPWKVFSSSASFLETMAELSGVQQTPDPSAMQLQSEIAGPTRRYATVVPRWTGESFLMRPGYDSDLQALLDKVRYAWTAKAAGQMEKDFEFAIDVFLGTENEEDHY